jgi:CubicO group peptidase (beta-lactamase class C family)
LILNPREDTDMNGSKTFNSLVRSLAILICFGLCRAQEPVNPDSSDVPQTTEELEAKLEGILDDHGISGGAFAVVSRDSVVWMNGLGYADLEAGEAVTESTLFRMASISKSLLGLAFLRLEEGGDIDLDAPVREIAPEIEFRNPWEETDPVRVIHLLEHTSGFDDIHFNSLWDKETLPLREALKRKPNARTVRWPPGTRYAYSSPGYAFAGYILEKVTGRPFEDYIEDHVLEPIGMTTSSFRLDDESLARLAVGYGGEQEPLPYADGFDRPASALNSSVREMARFMQFLLNDGRVGEVQGFDSTSMARLGIQTTTIAARAGLTEGYGFGVGIGYRDGLKFYGHSGAGPGFTATYRCMKDDGIGYVAMVNMYAIPGIQDISDLLFEFTTRGIERPKKASASVPTDRLEEFEGYYEYRSTRMQLFAFLDILLGGVTISLENDTLVQREFMEEKETLFPVSGNTFRTDDEPRASRAFTTTSDGKMVYVSTEDYYERTGAWKPFVYRFLFLAALILMLTPILYALFWIPGHLYKVLKGKENRCRFLRMRIAPVLAIISLVLGIFVFANQSMLDLSQRSVNNVVFFVSTLLFALFSLLTLIFTIQSFLKPVRFTARFYSAILSLAFVGMTMYLGYWGIIGLRIWAY